MTWFSIFVCLVAMAAPRPRVIAGLREPVNSLNPFAPTTIDGYRVGGLIYEPLARVNPRTNALEPWLARRWSHHGRSLRVELRANVNFHDGHALGAGDVVQTLARFRDPANQGATWLPLWQGITHARAVGPRRVEFTAARWTYEGVRNLLTNLRVQPAHRPAKDLVGTGPFQSSGPGLVFTAHDGWWHAPRPNFDLTFKTIGDESLARAMVQRGELDFFPVTNPGPGVREAGRGEGFWIDLNLRRPPFDDALVREALLLLWDRGDLNQKIFDGRRAPALDAFDPATPYYPTGRAVAFDPDRAEALLIKAGLVKSEGRWRRGERALDFELLVADPAQDRWATLLQTALKSRGITMSIKRRALDGEWWRTLRSGAFDAAAGGGAPSIEVNADAWASDGAYNVHGLRDQALDELLIKQNQEFVPARRTRREGRMIEIVRAHRAQLPGLFTSKRLFLTTPRLRIDDANPDDPAAWRVD